MKLKIYRRIKNETNRRVFYIDVGDLPPKRAEEIIEKVKAEIKGK